jgi:DNA-binding PadR family transcriptional regulator
MITTLAPCACVVYLIRYRSRSMEGGAVRVTYPTAIVLHALYTGHRYGFDIIDATGLGAGTVYPVLRRLEAEALARSSWEQVGRARAEGRPPRRNYRLSADGRRAAREALARYPAIAAQFDATVQASRGAAEA